MRSEIDLEQRLLTVDEFHAMGEAGILDEDERLELIDGRIIEMVPIGGPHMGVVNRLTRTLVARTPAEVTVSVQNPLRLGRHQEPQPDVVLLRPGAPADRVPTAEHALLVVEVADSSLPRDRDVKLPRYAAAGVPELWIVALADQVVEVCRRPAGGTYGERTRRGRGESLAIEALPEAGVLEVDEVLGDAPAE